MKHWMLAIALICFGSLAKAQSLDIAHSEPGQRAVLLAQADLPTPPADMAQAPAPVTAPAAPAAHAAAPVSIDLFQIGSDFGVDHAWKFGIDKSATVGACIQREIHDGQWLGGPCRDVFILAKLEDVKQDDGSTTKVLKQIAHLGGAIMYNTEHGNATYSVRAGVNVGPMAHAALITLAKDIPGLEGIANFKAPGWLAYAGSITTVDFAAGYRPVHTADVFGNWTYGPMVKVDIPLDDVYAILKAGI